jgi:uncharacterized membrane protein YedE/YeeE
MGNIVGGLLLGAGMAITGACPGTIIVQIALGASPGLYVACGGLVGGILFVKSAPVLHRTFPYSDNVPTKNCADPGMENLHKSALKQVHTIHERYGYNANTVLFVYETLCISMIGVMTLFAPSQSAYFNPILGGLFIGAAQACSILLSRKTLGVSTAYEQMGEAFWRFVSPWTEKEMQSYSAIRFALGIFLGAKMLVTYIPLLATLEDARPLSRLARILGGAIIIIGARLAGGCTSGHGISGMATMSMASFLTVGAMFAGGIGWSLLFV